MRYGTTLILSPPSTSPWRDIAQLAPTYSCPQLQPANMDHESFLKVVAQYMVAEVSDLRLGYKFGSVTAQRVPNGLPSSLSSENEYNNMIDKYLEAVEKQKKPKRKNASNESTKPTKIWICDVRTKEEIEQAKQVPSLDIVDN